MTEAHRWLRYAREDLFAAQSLATLHGVAPREMCYLAQQAAEKSIKAVLVLLQIDFSRSHNLVYLAGLLPTGWVPVPNTQELDDLTTWVAPARYPGSWPEPDEDDARESIALAVGILESIHADLALHGVELD